MGCMSAHDGIEARSSKKSSSILCSDKVEELGIMRANISSVA